MPSLRKPTDFSALMEPVALRLLGEPNQRLSKPPHDVRFGTHGSMSVNYETGEFYDHEAKHGGGVLDLVEHKTGGDRTEAVSWLRKEGLLNGALRPIPTEAPQSKIVATYDYIDEDGVPLFQVVRFAPKEFRQRQPGENEGEWEWNLKGVRRVIYRLPFIVAANASKKTIYIVEGEKDADRLAQLGFEATTNPMGANKWASEYCEALRGADVVLIPDNDPAGHDHVGTVAKFLTGIASRIRVLDLIKHWPECPKSGDVSDWLDADGTADALSALTDLSPDYMPESDAALLRTFAFVNDAPPAPQAMLIDDVLPLEGLPFIGGQSSAGKTFIAILMAACAATGKPFFGHEVKQRVGSVIVAAEGRAMLRLRILATLKNLEADERDVPIAWLKETPDFSNERSLDSFIDKLKALSDHFQRKFQVRLGLVFVDTVSASFDIQEEADNAEAARVCKTMMRIAERTGAIVVPIHHYGKNAAVGLRGASAWRASADIVLSVTADIDPMTGHVTNRQLSMGKGRDGAQGPITGFKLVPVSLGVDESGKQFGSMVAVAEGEAAKTITAWPPALAVFKQALVDALISSGKDEHPFSDGPVVKAVDIEAVKAVFTTLTHTDSPTEDGRKEAIRKQFTRKLTDAQQRHLIGVKVDKAGHAKLWLVRPDEGVRT